MKTIEKNTESIYEIKKSKFITKLYKINDLEEINSILKDLKEEYKDATHICYAYKIGNNIRFNDDGEPNGTAGIPILEVLNKKEITSCLAVVIRYFGGIKLGAGGLVRAYSRSIRDAIDLVPLIEFVKGKEIKVKCRYENTKQLDYLLKDKKIISKSYDQDVIYIIHLKEEDLPIINEYNYEIIKDIDIEK